MKKLKKRSFSFHPAISTPVLFAGLFAAVGIVYLLATKAATPTIATETEVATVTSPAVVRTSDTTASGSGYLQFGVPGGGNNTSRASLLSERSGFAKDATGGNAGPDCFVTSLADSGAGTLRSCAATGGNWISFKVNGTIVVNSQISIKSNTTVDGRQANITLTTNNGCLASCAVGAILSVNAQSNVIITNLKFFNLDTRPGVNDIEPGKCCDAIQFENSAKDGKPMTNLWVHHNSFKVTGDGATDISSTGPIIISATISWNSYVNVYKALLLSPISADSGSYNPNANITIHHNYFYQSASRLPLTRQINAHIYNNYTKDWTFEGSSSVAQVARNGSQILSENNVFSGKPGGGSVGCSDKPGPPAARSVGNLYVNGAPAGINCGIVTFVPLNAYSYTLDSTSTIESTIPNQAGWR